MAAGGQRGEQIPRARQRTDLDGKAPIGLGVQPCQPVHPLGADIKAGLTQELVHEQSAAHANAAVASGRMETAAWNLHALGVDPDKVPVVTRDQVKYAKPDPDLFVAAAARLDAPIETAVIIGDAIWDMLAARHCRLRCRPALWRLRPGGAGASRRAARVYEDPADLLKHLDEVGGRR
jgi:phosphoglycolate phosphatase-like HAD superfamily hydrolase